MPKSIYVQHLIEQPDSNPHYLNRLINLLNHFISIEPEDKPKGFESHHIVPESWKPEWKKVKDNLLKVPVKAHYIIHHLMWKAFPDSISMQRSFWYFCNNDKKQRITARVFENAKKDLKHSEETKQRMSISQKGRTHTDETKQKMSYSAKRKN